MEKPPGMEAPSGMEEPSGIAEPSGIEAPSGKEKPSGMEAPPQPPQELKPWYYQEWFMFPTAVFWPLWAILIIRSPWHNGLVSGAVAWAMLIVGGYFIIWEQLIPDQRLGQTTIVLIIPGLLLTVITQVHWARYRPALRAGLLSAESTSEAASDSIPNSDPAAGGRDSPASSGATKGQRRRRGSRAGRSRRRRS